MLSRLAGTDKHVNRTVTDFESELWKIMPVAKKVDIGGNLGLKPPEVVNDKKLEFDNKSLQRNGGDTFNEYITGSNDYIPAELPYPPLSAEKASHAMKLITAVYARGDANADVEINKIIAIAYGADYPKVASLSTKKCVALILEAVGDPVEMEVDGGSSPKKMRTSYSDDYSDYNSVKRLELISLDINKELLKFNNIRFASYVAGCLQLRDYSSLLVKDFVRVLLKDAESMQNLKKTDIKKMIEVYFKQDDTDIFSPSLTMAEHAAWVFVKSIIVPRQQTSVARVSLTSVAFNIKKEDVVYNANDIDVVLPEFARLAYAYYVRDQQVHKGRHSTQGDKVSTLNYISMCEVGLYKCLKGLGKYKLRDFTMQASAT